MEEDRLEGGGRGRSAALQALQAQGAGAEPPSAVSTDTDPEVTKRVTFERVSPVMPIPTAHGTASVGHHHSNPAAVSSPFASDIPAKDSVGASGGPLTNPKELEPLMRRLQFRSGHGLTRDALADGLRQLGYDLAPSEMNVLLDQLDVKSSNAEVIVPSEFVASQLDWSALQRSNRELWLECARRAFADLDKDNNGLLSAEGLVSSLRAKLPEDQVDFALEDAMVEAGYADADEMDFEGFLHMLNVGSFESLDSLDLYDPRLRKSVDLDASGHGAAYARCGCMQLLAKQQCHCFHNSFGRENMHHCR